ncbi:hypothetical protein [Cryptosporangium phraense]|uniref:Uncharacterized protein n=1 Tax=Cryptosporangium phraense TaxID=2593070 RepID=A0A545AYR5_9ACTN|nr:hypothetical protein [Cryptosporangium phraense]TQS46476.1 hypothetical protein FL583_03565 [Cryptosporangium phraense]
MQTAPMAVLRRPGTLLLLIVGADSLAYYASDTRDSVVALVCYLLQMFLVYRIWRGANLVPVVLLVSISGYEAYCVKQVLDAGTAPDHPLWVFVHCLAIMTTVFVLISGPVRGRIGPLRGTRSVE